MTEIHAQPAINVMVPARPASQARRNVLQELVVIPPPVVSNLMEPPVEQTCNVMEMVTASRFQGHARNAPPAPAAIPVLDAINLAELLAMTAIPVR